METESKCSICKELIINKNPCYTGEKKDGKPVVLCLDCELGEMRRQKDADRNI